MTDENKQSDEAKRTREGEQPYEAKRTHEDKQPYEAKQSDARDRLRRATPLPRAPKTLPDHPLRIALLDLLAEVGTVTSTEAAARLGESSGLCSFHLRQLARHGLIEEAPHQGGRARPWRLRWESDQPDGAAPDRQHPFTTLARSLEDTSHQHWLTHRDEAPDAWQHDESFSAVVHLTPQETAELAASVRHLLARFQDREAHPAARPAGTAPVAVIARLFPLLPENPGRSG
ncbi:winged helix-turn-helix domain-containing protein [Streptomyces sp. NPDC087440]|uniref:winged helix-turn-helix domain-containing protein n=1 Tax=Streptomyces sp. NPDC087440 TaxID=3365790 RepID=UPI003814B6FA